MGEKLRLYDIEIDEFREPTQDDINRLLKIQEAFGRLLMALPVLREVAIEMARGNLPIINIAEAIKKAKP